jgi:hypothetical protein
MKNFTNLVLLSTFIFGIISGNAAAAAALGGAASESGSSCYTKSETLSKLDTQGEKELVDVNERKGEKDYVVDKNEQAKTESEKNDYGSSGWKKSFKYLNSSKPAMFGLTVVPVAAAGFGITINKLLKDNEKKRIKEEEEKKRQKEEERKIGEEEKKQEEEEKKYDEENKGNSKGIPGYLKKILIIYGILATIICVETAIIQIDEGFLEREETESEIIFGSIRRGLLNGVTLGFLGLVKRDFYGGFISRLILKF